MTDNLLDYQYDKYSALGNDGIIGHILKIIGIKKGLFVEFGAWDGIFTSNCRKLFKEGWDGIFIECDRQKYKDLRKNYKKYDNIVCLNKMIKDNGKNIFDNVVDPYVTGKQIDFCSIDIEKKRISSMLISSMC